MPEAVNPLIPSGYDVVWSLIAIAALVLLIVALVSIGRSKALSPRQSLIWVLLAILVPVIGPTAWLVAGRRAAARSLS